MMFVHLSVFLAFGLVFIIDVCPVVAIYRKVSQQRAQALFHSTLHETDWDVLSCEAMRLPCDHIAHYEKVVQYLTSKHGIQRDKSEWLMFHGTNKKNIEQIVSCGFQPDKCKRTWFGKGCYFTSYAETACLYSHQATGTNEIDYQPKHMLLCQVVATNTRQLFNKDEWESDAIQEAFKKQEFDSYALTRYEEEPGPNRDMTGNVEEMCTLHPFQAKPLYCYEFKCIQK